MFRWLVLGGAVDVTSGCTTWIIGIIHPNWSTPSTWTPSMVSVISSSALGALVVTPRVKPWGRGSYRSGKIISQVCHTRIYIYIHISYYIYVQIIYIWIYEHLDKNIHKYLCIFWYTWMKCNPSLSWSKAIWGWFPLVSFEWWPNEVVILRLYKDTRHGAS